MKKVRESNFELLRIIAMLFIVLSHFNVHSGFMPENTPSVIFLISRIFALGCVSNFIFLLITGYFTIKSTPNYRKILGLIIELYFYSLVIGGVAFIIKGGDLTIEEIKATVLPFPFGPWFVPMYIMLYFFTPFLNRLINNLSKKEFRNLLILCFVLFVALPTINLHSPFSNLAVFIFGYMAGAYIRLYVEHFPKKRIFKILLASFTGLIALIIMNYFVAKILGFGMAKYLVATSLIQNSSIIPISLAIIVFLLFREVKIKNSIIINTVAGAVLGIYLIHENVFLVNTIWKKYFTLIQIR